MAAREFKTAESFYKWLAKNLDKAIGGEAAEAITTTDSHPNAKARTALADRISQSMRPEPIRSAASCTRPPAVGQSPPR